MDALLKKLIRDYNYLNETLGDVIEISNRAEGEFRTALMDVDPDAMEALKPKTQEVNLDDENVEVLEEHREPKHDDPKFKKLFRKLAVKCHPDKLGDIADAEAKFLKRVYEDLSYANENYDWGMLLKLAMELDVEFNDLGEEEIGNINENIELLRHNIERYETSMAYRWRITPSENQESYLKECAILFNQFLNKKSNDPGK